MAEGEPPAPADTTGCLLYNFIGPASPQMLALDPLCLDTICRVPQPDIGLFPRDDTAPTVSTRPNLLGSRLGLVFRVSVWGPGA